MDFVVIDFETANFKRDSACSIGIAMVHEGRITETWASLIRPPNMYFHPKIVAIHGITAADVVDAPSFDDIWAQILERIVTIYPVVAHNAAFDLSVLRASCAEHDLAIPEICSACTLKLARRLLPHLPNHRLDTVAGYLGIVFNHHDAESDAIACARVALSFCEMTQTRSIFEIGEVGYDTAKDFSEFRSRLDCNSKHNIAINGVSNLHVYVREHLEVQGKSVVITGELNNATRSEATELLGEKGATVKTNMSRQVEIVIVGQRLWDAWQRTGHVTGKLQRAVELYERGYPIQILSESEVFSE